MLKKKSFIKISKTRPKKKKIKSKENEVVMEK